MKYILKYFLYSIFFICCYIAYYYLVLKLAHSDFLYEYKTVLNDAIAEYFRNHKLLTVPDRTDIGILSILNLFYFVLFFIFVLVVYKKYPKKILMECSIVILLFLFPTLPKLEHSGRLTREPTSASECNFNSVKPLGVGLYYFFTDFHKGDIYFGPKFPFIKKYNKKNISIEIFGREKYLKPKKELFIEFVSIIIAFISMFFIRKYLLKKKN
jgi:Ca2+/Na+ antiporter